MNRLSVFLIFSFLSIKSFADTIEGASIEEIAARTESGMATFYRLLSLILVVVGLYMFASALIKLIAMVKGDNPQGKPMGALAGMLFASMLASTGFWLFAISGGLKAIFTT